MKKSLRIANLIDIPWFSGLTDYALNQADVLKETGHTVFFLAPKESKAFQIAEQKGYKTFPISDRKKILTPFEIFKIIKFIKNEKIDILNAHTGRMQTLSYIISLFEKNLKLVRTKSDAKEIKKSFTYSKISAVITGSKYIEKMYKEKKISAKIKTIYKSVPAADTYPIDKNPPFKIGIVGRLDPVKGHIWFIKSAIEILNGGFNCKFLISGIESQIKWPQLSSEIPLKYRDRFEYRGFSKNIDDFMRECHLGVITSTHSEAVSRAAVEWMKNARALISTEVGSLPEFVDKNFLTRTNEYKDLSEKIISILDFERLEKIGLENFEKLKSNFSYEKFKKETVDIFESLV
ncbi:MAG TPA: glycosyltransferase family 4 protein [Elusimicrobiales bacterium]|nr:glycosyltransferase family 4 protein [Elusimicrobiales bacterium]HOL61843.1 glycosyltransferase family 4 protein [Elusimicrobiales bacterium]HPO95178.1 glycosyltransferase family 4 protein [Elusimicrobiales bacterium]